MIHSASWWNGVGKRMVFYLFLAGLCSLVLLPFYVVIINSFKDITESSVISLSLPKRLLFENYPHVIKAGKLLRAFLNSFIFAGTSVVVNVLVSASAAHIIARRKTKMTNFLYLFFISGLIIPLAIIPEIRILQALRLMGTYPGVICIYVTAYIPFSFFFFTGFIRGIPQELDEAAIIDGSGPLRLFFQVIFPLLKPVTFTCVLVVFFAVWNDFRIAIYFIQKAGMNTAPLTIYAFTALYTARMNYICVDIILIMLPVIILFLLTQRYIIEGMTAGALKG